MNGIAPVLESYGPRRKPFACLTECEPLLEEQMQHSRRDFLKTAGKERWRSRAPPRPG